METQSDHACWYLGIIKNITLTLPATNEGGDHGSSPTRSSSSQDTDIQLTPRSPDVQLIDRVDNAQLEGRVSYTGSENTAINLQISKHGLKLSHVATSNVVERLPLHTIAQSVAYDDGYGRWNVAIKTGQVGKNQFVCHVFQTSTQAQAEAICQSLREVFAHISNTDR